MTMIQIGTGICFIMLFLVTLALMAEVVYCFFMMHRYEKKADALRVELQRMIDNRNE